ncbi:MAG: hypothetical protein KOO61_04785 [Spirochaetales bacterium]|nr:hypothetical protein [Spirochaetales bacterium]
MVVNELSSGNFVGSARYASDLGMLSIVVEPKVPVYRLAGIIEYVQEGRVFSDELAEVYGAHTDILSLQLHRCVRLVLSSLAAGSVRGYRQLEREVACIKGRPNLVKLVCEAPLQAKQSVHCCFSDHTINTPRNQVYRAALVKCAKILSERGSVQALDAARMTIYSLNAVDNKDLSKNQIEGIARAHLKDSATLLACRDVICGLSISPHPGIAREFFSYAINMATLFEDYCYRLMSTVLAEFDIRPSDDLTFPLDGGGQTIKLDGLFGEIPNQILMECKYKSIRSIPDLSRADIYQTVSYCCHVNLRPMVAVICVPAFEDDAPVELLGTIGGFRAAKGKIHVLSISLSHRPDELEAGLAAVFSRLLEE